MNKIILLLSLLILNGCGMKETVSDFMAGDDNEIGTQPLVEIEQALEIEKRWSRSIGDGSDGYYLKLSPTIDDGIIYVAERDGYVFALDAVTGKKIWKQDTDKPLSGGPGLGEGLVLMGSKDGEVVALSAENGEPLWATQLSSEVLSAPKADLGVVVARTVDGKVYGLDIESGKRLWIYEHSVPLLSLRGNSSPQLDSGKAVIGFDGGTLVALNIIDGTQDWLTKIARPTGRSDLDRMVDIDGEPFIEDGVIYVATFQGRVAVVSLESGQLAWVRDVSSYAGLCADYDRVYLTDEKSEILALDRYSGDLQWQQDILKTRALTAPITMGEHIVVGDFEGYLHWLRGDDGELVGRMKLDSSKILMTPFVADDILYAYSSDGTLAAYSVQ